MPHANSFQPVEIRPAARCTADEVARLDAELDQADPIAIVEAAHDRFGDRLKLTASFADTTLIDVALRVVPDIEVIFLDTGFHFSETLRAVRRAMARYHLNLTVLRPDRHADDLWQSGTTACCEARKVTPLANYLTQHADAWLSGVRRADSPARANAATVALDRRGLVKFNPLVSMTDEEYDDYVVANDVIVNTLRDDGYASIGCWPCTEPAADRSGRWAASNKTECGLHL